MDNQADNWADKWADVDNQEDKENDGNEKKMRLFKRKKMGMIKRCEL